MYCKNCGEPIDNSMVLCEKCQKQSLVQNTDANTIIPTQLKTEEVIFAAERADDYKKNLVISLGIQFLFSMIYILAYSIVPIEIEELLTKRLGYMKAQAYMEELNSMPGFTVCFTVILVVVIISLFFDIFIYTYSMIKITKISLCCTNIGLVGNTGELFGNTTLHAPYSDIFDVTLKRITRKGKYGNIVIFTKWGTKYTFFIKNPYSFFNRYKEIRKQFNS